MATQERILIIDDEETIRAAINRILVKDGYEVTTVDGLPTARKLIDKVAYDLIILDLFIPGGGINVIKEVKADEPEVEVIVISGQGTIEAAVESMKQGAYSFLAKPFTPGELRKVVGQALEKRRLALENLYLRREWQNRGYRTQTVYRSPTMAQVMEIVGRVAPTDSTVLLTGESGTGKSLIARRIHELSRRAGRPFVTVDCGTLVETLFESELFGHVKGAFTGADSGKIGKFELAHNGTIFFDEISNINLDVQAKLLKAVDDREISKVGSHRTINVDVRIIAATNQDLKAAISVGRFREDLYYRLNVVSIHVPPLRERREDVPALVDFFLHHYNQRRNMRVTGLSPEVMKVLLAYDWPGNVRELSNLVERLVVLGREGDVELSDLNFAGWTPTTAPSPSTEPQSLTLDEMERTHIIKVLALYQGNKSESALALGIDRKTLREKIRKYELE